MLDTHNDNPPDNDNWHTDVTFIDTPPAGAILAAKELPSAGETLYGPAELPLMTHCLSRFVSC